MHGRFGDRGRAPDKKSVVFNATKRALLTFFDYASVLYWISMPQMMCRVISPDNGPQSKATPSHNDANAGNNGCHGL